MCSWESRCCWIPLPGCLCANLVSTLCHRNWLENEKKINIDVIDAISGNLWAIIDPRKGVFNPTLAKIKKKEEIFPVTAHSIGRIPYKAKRIGFKCFVQKRLSNLYQSRIADSLHAKFVLLTDNSQSLEKWSCCPRSVFFFHEINWPPSLNSFLFINVAAVTSCKPTFIQFNGEL